jgi:hypothetical protein
MTRARDVSRLVTTPTSAYDEFEEVFVGSASPTNKKIWIDSTTASAPVMSTLSSGQWYGSIMNRKDIISVQYLIIAGGGGGGAMGGGGAGGYRSSVIGELSGGNSLAESLFMANPGQTYSITIGSGGATRGLNGTTVGNKGSNSIFAGLTSEGGGGGGAHDPNGQAGASGGSGGGGGSPDGNSPSAGGGGGGAFSSGLSASSATMTGGTGVSAQGTNGGSGSGDSSVPGNGGSGYASSITGSSITRAGGGAGGSYIFNGTGTTGTGGSGGGGNGGRNGLSATPGTQNTGSGGGGTGFDSTGNLVNSGNGGAGGSGIVILKFPDRFSVNVGAGLTSTNISSGGFKIYTFTAGTDTVVFS